MVGLEEDKLAWTHVLTALVNKHSSVHHRTTEKNGDDTALGRDLERYVDSGFQTQMKEDRTELDGYKWPALH